MHACDRRKCIVSRRLMLAICLTTVLAVGLLSNRVPTGYGYAAEATCRMTGLTQTHWHLPLRIYPRSCSGSRIPGR